MRYFIIGATYDHVQKGISGGFAQSGHGKRNNLDRLSRQDWIIYYSSKDKLEKGKPIQQFTAIGQVADDASYQANVSETFNPYRRYIEYMAGNAADIRPLLDKLEFIKDVSHWGFYLMSGFVEINEHDYAIISHAMGIE